MKVLVCGGRDFDDYNQVHDVLGRIHHGPQGPVAFVIQGGARGADSLGRQWAEDHDVNGGEWPPDWERHGKRAGPIRNQLMIDEGKPDLVVAFPGGTGTADMVRRARKAGVEVVEVHRG